MAPEHAALARPAPGAPGSRRGPGPRLRCRARLRFTCFASLFAALAAPGCGSVSDRATDAGPDAAGTPDARPTGNVRVTLLNPFDSGPPTPNPDIPVVAIDPDGQETTRS